MNRQEMLGRVHAARGPRDMLIVVVVATAVDDASRGYRVLPRCLPR